MISAGGVNSNRNVNKPMRVQTGTNTTLAQLLLIKRQIDFQTDLLQSALQLYMTSQNKLDRALLKGEAGAALKGLSGESSAGYNISDKETKSYLEAILGAPMDDETRKRFNSFLEMRKSMETMRQQRDSMQLDPDKPRLPVHEPLTAPQVPPSLRNVAPPPVNELPIETKPKAPGPTPILPDWNKDPSKWTMWLLEWLIASRVLPGAYAEINFFANMANWHNEEMNALEKLEALLYRLENNKSPIPSKYRKYFTQSKYRGDLANPQWWASHSKLRAAIYSDLKPIIQLEKSLSYDVKKFGGDGSVGSMFKKLQSDLLHQIGSKGVDLSGNIGKFVDAFKDGNFSEMAKFKFTIFKDFYKLFNQAPQITQKTSKGGTRVVKNPYWSRAWNNVTNGPWKQANDDFKGLSNTLTNLSTQDQTNLRTAFFALTTKVNAASDLLTTTGQMMSALAQNMRSSA